MMVEAGLNEYVSIDFVRELGRHVYEAAHEGEFSERLTVALLNHSGCDAVILRLVNRQMDVRAVATPDGTDVVAPASLSESFTAEDQERWLSVSDGVFCQDVHTSPHIKPRFREHALQIGVAAGFMTPLVQDGELYGQVVFGWRQAPRLEETDRRHLRGVADIASYHLTAFWLRTAQQYDPLTGLRNRLGLERFWANRDKSASGALLFADVDGLKALNSARGYLEGDDYLRRAARVLLVAAPPLASVFRIGGDRFVVDAPDLSEQEADGVAQEIRASFKHLAETMLPPRPAITVAIGRYPEDGDGIQDVLQVADERLRQQRQQRNALRAVLPVARHPVHPASKTAPTSGAALVGAAGLFGDAPSSLVGSSLVGSSPDASLLDGSLLGAPANWLTSWPDGIVVTDPGLKITFVNRTYEKTSGYSLNEWLGKTPSFVASGKTPLDTYRQMWDSLNNSGSWTGHVINRRRNGTEWVSFLSIIRIVAADDRLLGYLATARDVSHSLWPDMPSIQDPFQEVFTQEGLAFALAEAGQMHEGGTRLHLERIRDYTRLLVLGGVEKYEALQRYETRTAIVMASILHDIGKLSVPEGLLRKPARLTKEEYKLVQTHTVAGEKLLQSPYLNRGLAVPPSQFLSVAAAIARSHHERWDGGGYPDGLAKEEIPLGARIVTVADVYDALRSSRPYKPPWKHDEALNFIMDGAGTSFDPGLVRILVDMEAEFNDIARAIDNDRDMRTDGYAAVGAV